MCVIDTAHDFGKSRSTYKVTYAQREIIINLLSSVIGYENVMAIFKNITTIESAMNDFLNSIASPLPVPLVPPEGVGIVYDQGSPSPSSRGVGDKMVYTVAKLMDPAM